MSIKCYTSSTLSAEDYHAETDHIGGSALWEIYTTCPAQWKFRERKETKALADGRAIHAAILEKNVFDQDYYGGLDREDYTHCLFTAKDMTAWLKSRGVKCSGKTFAELEAECLKEDSDVRIWRLICEEWDAENAGKEMVKADLYDQLEVMRNVLFSDGEIAKILTSSENELSIMSDDTGAKCRIDIMSTDGEIWDYKTCRDSSPESFSKSAHDYGYWFKMALQGDLFEQYYGYKPKKVGLIAQSKTKPYIAQAYKLTDEQLDIGREQYKEALLMYSRCKDMDSWPTFGGGIQELPTPTWIASRYGMEIDGIEITGGE